MFVAGRIHNNSIGRLFEVDSLDAGADFIIGMAEEQLERELTDDERETLVNDYELYVEADADNEYTWFVAVAEEM